MAAISVSPDKIAQAVVMRAAGYTVTAIADRLAISVRTLQRVFEHHKTKKGAATDELIEAAKRNLIEGVTSNDRIKEEAARLIADDLAHVRLLRARMADATEHMTATNLPEAVLLMRAAAAYSTAIKNSSDTLRHSLGTERAMKDIEAEEIPTLTVYTISDADALKMSQEAAGRMRQPTGRDTDTADS